MIGIMLCIVGIGFGITYACHEVQPPTDPPIIEPPVTPPVENNTTEIIPIQPVEPTTPNEPVTIQMQPTQ